MTEMNLEEFTKTKKLKLKVEVGDLYLKQEKVYQIGMYNETADKVVLGTTNDTLHQLSTWTPRLELRNSGYFLCPLDLRAAAIDIMTLKEHPTPEAEEALRKHRETNLWVYERYGIEQLLPHMESREFRSHAVGDDQADVSPNLRGMEIKLPLLFYCLSKEEAKRLYKAYPIDSGTYKDAMKFKSWPICYIPRRFS